MQYDSTIYKIKGYKIITFLNSCIYSTEKYKRKMDTKMRIVFIFGFEREM